MSKTEIRAGKIVLSAWADALAIQAMDNLRDNATTREKAAAMQELLVKVLAAREYERWDPRSMESVVVKRNYRQVEEIGNGSGVKALQFLPDGRIVSGSRDHTIRIWSQGSDGKWSSEVLEGHRGSVVCLQALPDGRIVSGSADNTIRIWDGESVAGGV